MVGTDESAELWWPDSLMIQQKLFFNVFAFYKSGDDVINKF